jgi:hypothetical protein
MNMVNMEDNYNAFGDWLTMLNENELRYWRDRARKENKRCLGEILNDELQERRLPKFYTNPECNE